jgi:hypothetical protein
LNAQAFIRNRLLPFPVLISFIINFIRRSLQIEISNFASFLKMPDVSKQAFSQARKKLSHLVFILLNQKLLEEFYTDNDFKTFKGLRILAIDGSTIRLPDNEEVYAEFGSQITKEGKKIGVPLAKTSVVYDVLNQMMIHVSLNHYSFSEKRMAIENFDALSKLEAINNTKIDGNPISDLLLFDRGYPSAFLMFYIAQELKKQFLMRVNSRFLKEINETVKNGTRDEIITISARRKYQDLHENFAQYMPWIDKDASMQIRVAVFDLSSGEKEIIVTSLLDQDQFTYSDLFEMYNMRWGAEENYKLIKCVARIENFSGESKLAVLQDFYATVFTCNISSLLSLEAQEELEQESSNKECKYTYKINRNILIGAIKNEILEVLLGDSNLEEYCKILKQRIKRSLVSVRPGRSFERPKKRYANRHPFIHRLVNHKGPL